MCRVIDELTTDCAITVLDDGDEEHTRTRRGMPGCICYVLHANVLFVDVSCVVSQGLQSERREYGTRSSGLNGPWLCKVFLVFRSRRSREEIPGRDARGASGPLFSRPGRDGKNLLRGPERPFKGVWCKGRIVGFDVLVTVARQVAVIDLRVDVYWCRGSVRLAGHCLIISPIEGMSNVAGQRGPGREARWEQRDCAL